LILTAHSDFDMDMVVKHAPFVFDTRNGTKRAKGAKPNVAVL
jgi:UDP-N-acetyl-D-mannosaminuronate dehydrogenase